MRRPTTSLAVPVVLAASALLVSACTSGSSSSTSASSSAAASSSAVASEAAASPSFGEAWESVSCDALGLDPAFTEIADCGYVTVPENRASGSDATIRLAVARVRALGPDAGLPIVFGEGGPGANGFLNVTVPALSKRAAILQNHDYVFFSQRGTSKAEPSLQCPEYNAVMLSAAVAGQSIEERRADQRAAFQACIDGFRSQGVDFAAYNTNENADDVADIVKALGYDKVVYEGASYGTWLGQVLAQRHPEILAGLVLDGVAPLTATAWSDISDYAAMRKVWAACAADAACAAAYPDPEAVLTEVIAGLDASPQTVDITLPDGSTQTVTVDGALAMEALFGSLVGPTGARNLPSIVYRMGDGDLQYALAPLLAGALLSSENARAMHFAVNCSDDPVTEADAVNPDVPAPYASVLAREVLEGVDACAILDVPQLGDESDAPFTTDIPTLILQGGLDPATPVSGGDEVASGLSKVTNAIIPAGAHVQGLTPCGAQIIASFANDPTGTPDTSCIDPAVPMAVALRPTVESPDGSGSITATLPAGLLETAPGNYSDATHVVVLGAYPKVDNDVAIESLVKTYETLKPVGATVDGPEIAGLPSRHFVGTADGYAPGAGADIFAFSDDTTTYVIVGFYSDAATLESVFRGNQLAALLQSVELGG
jgi:pimeloyl-ACP methyl ester carboxylesterase